MDPVVVLVDAALPTCLPPSSSRLPPFSLADFCALVSAALDSDAPAPPLALSLRAMSPSVQRNTSAQNLHAPPTVSRMRLLLTKLKKRAAALIVRRRRPPATATLRAPALSATMSCNLDRSSGGESLFSPYLPLVVQYERGLVVPSTIHSFTCASPPSSSSVPSAPATSLSSFAFASASACPSESSHATPSATASTFSESTCTSKEHPYSALTAAAPFPCDGGASDPFAKRAMRVVRHVRAPRPLSASYSPPCNLHREGAATRRTGQRRRSHSKDEGETQMDDSGVYVQEEPSYDEQDQDWTLTLPALPSASCRPPRASTPPPNPRPPAGTSSPSASTMARTVPSPSSLTRAPTACTSPIATAPKDKSRCPLPQRPSSPFQLQITRSATSPTSTMALAYACACAL